MAACIASILEFEGTSAGRKVHKLCGTCVKVHLGIYMVLLNITTLLESFLDDVHLVVYFGKVANR